MAIKVTGLREVEAQLLKLGSKDGTKVLRSGMLRAAKPIEQQAESNAAAIPGGSGALEKAIGRRFQIAGRGVFGEGSLPRMGGRFEVVIAPFNNSRVAIALYNLFYRRKRRGIFHGHFVEFKNSGGRKILSRALNTRGAEAVQSLAREIKVGIERLLRRRG
jgi:hypothetical protein